jgi:methionine-S-sulfoxide reductase
MIMTDIFIDGSPLNSITPDAGMIHGFTRESYALRFRQGEKSIFFVAPYSGILHISGDYDILEDGLLTLWYFNLKIGGISAKREIADSVASILEEKYFFTKKLFGNNGDEITYLFEEGKRKRALFAGGCFWCIASPFYDQDGVFEVKSGFAGGKELNPSYSDVKAQITGHRESILIEYDNNKVEYYKLVDIYFENIDPFDDGGQYIDRGDSYSPAVFTSDIEEKKSVVEYKYQLSDECERECKVPILDNTVFFLAEEEHQNYAIKNKEEFEKELIASGRKKI